MKKELQERLVSCMHEFAAVIAAIYAEPDGHEYVAKSTYEAAHGSILLANIGLSYTSDSANTKDKVYPSVVDCSIGMYAADRKTFKLFATKDYENDKPEDFDWSNVSFTEYYGKQTISSGTLKEAKYVEE